MQDQFNLCIKNKKILYKLNEKIKFTATLCATNDLITVFKSVKW